SRLSYWPGKRSSERPAVYSTTTGYLNCAVIDFLPTAKARGFPSSDTHPTVGWVVRASQNPPSRRSGLTCPPRATTASPAAVLLAGPLAIGTNQGIHTCSSLNVLPTRAFPGGMPRTMSCEGEPRRVAQRIVRQGLQATG